MIRINYKTKNSTGVMDTELQISNANILLAIEKCLERHPDIIQLQVTEWPLINYA